MTLNVKTLAQELEDFRNPEEGKAVLKEWGEKLIREHAHKNRWQEKTAKLLESKTDEELDSLYAKYLKHAQKRSDILYEQNIDGESSLNAIILEAFSKAGKVSKKKKDYGMFTSIVYRYRGFKAELICGQGCFISIDKIK